MNGRAVWANVVVPVVAPEGWTRPDILEGLRDLERIRRRVDAASAVLIGGLGTKGRDTGAAIARATGSSARAGRDRAGVAEVVAKVGGAGAALASGEVSSEHLRALVPVVDTPEAASLIALAAGQTPEEFETTVKQFQLDRDPDGVRKRQRRARSVKYFDAEHGCFGIRGVLTPTEGAELRGRLQQIADAAWRGAHPDRAERLGGHDAPPLRERLADALMALVRGEAGIVLTKPSVVIVVKAETLEADIAGTGPGSGPIPFADAAVIAERANLYGAVRSMSGQILNFGRSRRFATSIQRLALIVRDGGKCVIDGCDVAHDRCVVHHTVEDQHGGLTNIEFLALIMRPTPHLPARQRASTHPRRNTMATHTRRTCPMGRHRMTVARCRKVTITLPADVAPIVESRELSAEPLRHATTHPGVGLSLQVRADAEFAGTKAATRKESLKAMERMGLHA